MGLPACSGAGGVGGRNREADRTCGRVEFGGADGARRLQQLDARRLRGRVCGCAGGGLLGQRQTGRQQADQKTETMRPRPRETACLNTRAPRHRHRRARVCGTPTAMQSRGVPGIRIMGRGSRRRAAGPATRLPASREPRRRRARRCGGQPRLRVRRSRALSLLSLKLHQPPPIPLIRPAYPAAGG